MNDRIAKHKRVHLHVEDTGGDGPVIILIHDWPLTVESVRGHVAPLVGAGFRVVCYDRRGFGSSERPADGYDYHTLALDLLGLIADRGLSDVTVIGFGMGAAEMVHAYQIARDFKSVYFCSTVTPYVLEAVGNDNGWISPGFYEAMRESLRNDRTAFFTTLMTQYYSVDGELLITPQQRDDLVKVCEGSDENAALKCFESLCTTDHRPQFNDWDVLTAFFHGDSDDFAPKPHSAEATHDLLPSGLEVTLRGGPHGFNLTHLEKFNRALVADLTGARAGVHDTSV